MGCKADQTMYLVRRKLALGPPTLMKVSLRAGLRVFFVEGADGGMRKSQPPSLFSIKFPRLLSGSFSSLRTEAAAMQRKPSNFSSLFMAPYTLSAAVIAHPSSTPPPRSLRPVQYCFPIDAFLSKGSSVSCPTLEPFPKLRSIDAMTLNLSQVHSLYL